LGGKQVKLQVAHTKLSHSRAFIVRAYLLLSRDIQGESATNKMRSCVPGLAKGVARSRCRTQEALKGACDGRGGRYA
jgi:hypothetical protein